MKKHIYQLMTDQRQGPAAKAVLLVFSAIYGGVVRVTRALYAQGIVPSYKSPKPVISIGNVTVGGAGKTPLVIAVINVIRSAGLRPAVLSRGYMAEAGTPGDEPAMMAELFMDVPVLVGADRADNIRASLHTGGIDVFVCDDAFQHWPLKRDLDIVAVDALNPFGNGHMLPRGILREPLNALKRAHLAVITRADRNSDGITQLRKRLWEINPQLPVVESIHQPLGLTGVYDHAFRGLDLLRGKKIAAFCAIADPDAFGHSLAHAGADVVKRSDFMDHHVYTNADISTIRDFCRSNSIDTVVTTHKDAVKIVDLGDAWEEINVMRLNIGLTITNGNEQFIQRILSACHS